MTMAEAICCTLVNCTCDSFKPGKLKKRLCEHCKHGWVAHALSKLKLHHMYQGSQVEIVHSNVVFDICSLMLYGTQAIPVRLKILLDRLFSVLKQEEVIQILNALDWTLQDYIRGYVLQDIAGKVLDRWAIMTFEEEIATLQQFLRFGETKSIVELMALQDKEGQAVLVPSTRTNSDIRTFIERSTPRTATTNNILTPKVEKLSSSKAHHFENFINSMAFMLPFQLLGSVPAPLLGSPLGALQQQGGQMEQGQRRGDENPNALPLPGPPPTENSLVGSSSASFTSDLDRGGDNPMDGLSATPKMEAEDFPTSDNYSDGRSTPCTPSMMNSDFTQMSPDSKLQQSMDRNGGGGGGSLKKGRVYCSACDKTFYDKGTLKIHYNAVHLKIKHKCTIDGCNMVFSSLRSRNRHSANPNPRLHMPMNRNNRDKDLRGGGSLSADEDSEASDKPRSEYPHSSIPVSLTSSPDSQKSVASYMVSHVDSTTSSTKLHHSSSFPSMGHLGHGILFPNLKTVQPVLPFYRSLVTPAELANSPGQHLPSLTVLSSSLPLKSTSITAPDACGAIIDPVPKKKSRKSSMPIKIEKEAVEREGRMGEDSGSEDMSPIQGRDKEECERGVGGGGDLCTRQMGVEREREREERGVILAGERGEREEVKRPRSHSPERDVCGGREQEEDEEEKEEGSRQAETGMITCASSPYDGKLNHRENHSLSLSRDHTETEGEEGDQPTSRHQDKPCDDMDHRLTNGGVFRLGDRGKDEPEGCMEDYTNSSLLQSRMDSQEGPLDRDDLPHHCEICSKTFNNQYSVKMHYRNVHLKEMHMCTVAGCNAAFPSRRSRDRHSSNLNLHHKLLTKDLYSPSPRSLYSPASLCRDKDPVSLDYRQDLRDLQRDRELQRDTGSQTSVIFRGHNRMGLVFPMSKMADERTGENAGEELEGGGGVEEGAVLDLSTSSSVPPRGGGSAPSSWDSDGAGSEEGEGLEEEPLPMEEDSDGESCDGIGLGVPVGEGLSLGGDRTLGCGGGGQMGPQGGGGGSPITCHVCQKVYSNKGTFRAHYKTVHLRLLHKCKVPGCDTTFSSVRSRNRHSQNPNLHRNLTGSGGGTTLDQE
ncbi:zinc finger protein basonuclin-1-like isoform X2 [Oncorhynchus mykiss]|uniref:Basonuclin zinc finger protein 1 n=1 Tax=Oncorhynchus mykiss TaxID=8022 RepID=A0A8K9V8T8_ONCMY|nr:zinc finger protein basonuclin-1-like isoform X2 [Oncorhynchus mykiss]